MFPCVFKEEATRGPFSLVLEAEWRRVEGFGCFWVLARKTLLVLCPFLWLFTGREAVPGSGPTARLGGREPWQLERLPRCRGASVCEGSGCSSPPWKWGLLTPRPTHQPAAPSECLCLEPALHVCSFMSMRVRGP